MWQSHRDWLDDQREYKSKLLKDGKRDVELFEALTTRNLFHKLATNKTQQKCHRCWHPTTNNNDKRNAEKTSSSSDDEGRDGRRKIRDCCICPRLEPLMVGLSSPLAVPSHIKFLILMHPKEFYCAGNSAKLLLQLLPNNTELYIFGKLGEVDRLFGAMMCRHWDDDDDDDDNNSNTRKWNPWQNTMTLWPSPDACSIDDFLENQQQQQQQRTAVETTTISKTSSTTSNVDGYTSIDESVPSKKRRPLNIVVLDGTYTQARNMRKSLRKRIRKGQIPVTVRRNDNHDIDGNSNDITTMDLGFPQDVAVRPVFESVFHRAQKNYGEAHQRTKRTNHNHKNSRDESTTALSAAAANAASTSAITKVQRDESEAMIEPQSSTSPPPPSSSSSSSSPPSQQDPIVRRVSTAEACGMLLVELGLDPTIHERIVEAVKINNDALTLAAQKPTTSSSVARKGRQ